VPAFTYAASRRSLSPPAEVVGRDGSTPPAPAPNSSDSPAATPRPTPSPRPYPSPATRKRPIPATITAATAGAGNTTNPSITTNSPVSIADDALGVTKRHTKPTPTTTDAMPTAHSPQTLANQNIDRTTSTSLRPLPPRHTPHTSKPTQKQSPRTEPQPPREQGSASVVPPITKSKHPATICLVGHFFMCTACELQHRNRTPLTPEIRSQHPLQ